MVAQQQSYRLGATNNLSVATTSTSLASAAFGAQTYQVRIASPAACFYAIGTAPTATTTDVYLPANWVDIVTVTPGQKVSVHSPTIQAISIVEITG